MTDKRKNIVLLLVFFALIFSLRIIHPGADPPKDLSISMGYYGDPGGYAFNARNKIVFDRWEMDEWNMMHISPLPHYMNYTMFLVFGPGIAPMNIVPILFSCLLLVFLFFTLKKNVSEVFAVIGVFLLGVNFPFTMFSRIAVRAVEMVFFVVLAIWLLAWSRGEDKMKIFLAGAATFLAFTVKGTFLLILPSLLLGTAAFVFFQQKNRIKKTLSSLLVFILGMAAVCVIWLFFIYFPHREIFLTFGGENFDYLAPQRLQTALKNFWERPLYFLVNMPVLTLLSSLGLLVLAFRLVTHPKNIFIIEGIAGLWFVSNSLYFSVIWYRPARHFIPLVVSIVFLSIYFLRDFSLKLEIKKPKQIPLLFFPFLFIWFLFPVSGFFILQGRPHSLMAMRTRFFQTLVLSLLLTGFVFLILKIWPQKWRIPFPRPVRIAVIAFLIVISTGFHIRPYMKWAFFPRFDVRTISRDLGLAFEHINIAGLIAPVISLENRHEAHPYYTNYVNKGLDFLDKYRITHIFTSTNSVEKTNYERDFPDALKNARLLARYPLGRTYLELYELNAGPVSLIPIERVYEGEIFFGENGLPRYDPDASGRLAFRVEQSKHGSLGRLPDLEFLAGDHEVVFMIKSEKDMVDGETFGRIDVLEPQRRKVIATMFLKKEDFQVPGDYKEFPLNFRIRRSSSLTLRFYGTGDTPLLLDKVVVKGIP